MEKKKGCECTHKYTHTLTHRRLPFTSSIFLIAGLWVRQWPPWKAFSWRSTVTFGLPWPYAAAYTHVLLGLRVKWLEGRAMGILAGGGWNKLCHFFTQLPWEPVHCWGRPGAWREVQILMALSSARKTRPRWPKVLSITGSVCVF